MSKKTVGIAGIVVTLITLTTLFVNIVFSDKSENADITFFNVDALAEEESTTKPQCVESGMICVGSDKNGIWGRHQGLNLNPELWQE